MLRRSGVRLRRGSSPPEAVAGASWVRPWFDITDAWWMLVRDPPPDGRAAVVECDRFGYLLGVLPPAADVLVCWELVPGGSWVLRTLKGVAELLAEVATTLARGAWSVYSARCRRMERWLGSREGWAHRLALEVAREAALRRRRGSGVAGSGGRGARKRAAVGVRRSARKRARVDPGPFVREETVDEVVGRAMQQGVRLRWY